MAEAMLFMPMSVSREFSARLSNSGELGSSSSSSSDSLRSVSLGWCGSALHGVGGRTIKSLEARNFSIKGGASGGYINRIVMRSGGDKKNDNNLGDDQVETLFMRELRRRGISSKERDGAPLGSTGTETKTKEESEGGGSFFRGWSLPGAASTKPPPQLTESQRDEQMKRSMALNSEGLDGLIPRGTELLKLGSSFFVVFWPFILASLAAFGAVYVYFGSAFIHTGNSFDEVGRPPYVDPYQLLEEEVLPPQMGPDRVPFNTRADDGRRDSSSP